MGEAVLRKVGVEVHGIRMPVIRRSDDLVKMAAEHLVEAAVSGYAPFTIRDRDVVGVTESLVARAQGNIVTLEEIAADVRDKIPEGDAAVAFPILALPIYCVSGGPSEKVGLMAGDRIIMVDDSIIEDQLSTHTANY